MGSPARASRSLGALLPLVLLLVGVAAGQAASPTGWMPPFRNPELYAPPIGMDWDRAAKSDKRRCQGYRAKDFPNCYDQHEGTDYMLLGWFPQMDLQVGTDVVAVAPGKVTAIEMGKPDHCFADPTVKGDRKIRCPGAGGAMDANFVRVEQDDGYLVEYYHLERDTVAVRPGRRVATGDLIGKIGSSGISSSPHLHLTVTRVGGDPSGYIDPYKTPEGKALWAQLDARNVPAFPTKGPALRLPGVPLRLPAGGPKVATPTAAPQPPRAQHPEGDPGPTVPCIHRGVAHPGQKHETGVRLPCAGHVPNPGHRHMATAPCAHPTSEHPGGDPGPRVPCIHLVR